MELYLTEGPTLSVCSYMYSSSNKKLMELSGSSGWRWLLFPSSKAASGTSSVLTAREAGQGKWRHDTKPGLEKDSKKLLRAKGSVQSLPETKEQLS